MLPGIFIILLFYAAGEFIGTLTGGLIPGSVIGMILLFAALCGKVVKPETVRPVARFLTDNMGLFFLPAGVGIVNSAQVLAAGFAFSNDAGIVAGVYNIGRVICLPLVVLMLAIMVAAEDAKVHSQLANTSKMRIILDKFPVFVLGFLAVVLLNTFGFMSKEEAKMAGNFMNWCFLLGFSSIGLTTHLSDIKAAGLSGALIGFCVASVKAGLALLVVLCFLQ